MVASHAQECKSAILERVKELNQFIVEAAKNGATSYEVESELFKSVLEMGRLFFAGYVALVGTGDVGETLQVSPDTTLERQPELKSREYTTVFGTITVDRTIYSRGAHQKSVAPLDARLDLPESKFSYLLQSWDQMIATEQPYDQVSKVLERILGFKQHCDSLERMSRMMSDNASDFTWTLPFPPVEEEGELLVQSADGKGVPIRRLADTQPIEDHQHNRGPKPDRKRMATLGTVYSVDRNVRTPQDILDALFHDPTVPRPDSPERPKPQHKWTYALLDEYPRHAESIDGQPAVFGWLDRCAVGRWRQMGPSTPRIALMDGQKSLWNLLEIFGSQDDIIKILDLLHVTPRIWDAAKIFHDDLADQKKFVYDKTSLMLHGKVTSVVHSLRSLATRRNLSVAKKKSVEVICKYFLNNADRMKYDEYLAAGYPIASGAIEGACCHLVKDRMERTGMSWSRNGAQAMLHLRAIWISDKWDEFMKYRMNCERKRLYPYLESAKLDESPIAA